MEDSYHTNGARADRARTWKLTEEQNAILNRIANSLEDIAEKFRADADELPLGEPVFQKGSGFDPE